MHQAPTSTDNPRDKPNLIDGRLLIAGTALGCVVLFFIVWGSIRSVEHHIRDAQPVLKWAERETWFAPSVIQTTLVKPNAANAQYTYNKPRYRDPGLEISPEEEAAIRACAEVAASPRFADLSNEETFYPLADNSGYFYAKYLLATRYALGDDRKNLSSRFYQEAIDLAPKIIVIQYTDVQGNPVADLKLDRIEIGCDRVTDGGETLDQRLVLVYPSLKTDATGRVYLPVYDTIYRPVYLPQPDGYEVAYTPGEGWFKLPTKLGTINARTTRVQE
jgi:hypothetical protein